MRFFVCFFVDPISSPSSSFSSFVDYNNLKNLGRNVKRVFVKFFFLWGEHPFKSYDAVAQATFIYIFFY